MRYMLSEMGRYGEEGMVKSHDLFILHMSNCSFFFQCFSRTLSHHMLVIIYPVIYMFHGFKLLQVV